MSATTILVIVGIYFTWPAYAMGLVWLYRRYYRWKMLRRETRALHRDLREWEYIA